MVDAQVHRGHLVAAAAYGTLPLHHLGSPSPEPVARREESAPVLPGGMELGVEGTAFSYRRQALPVLG